MTMGSCTCGLRWCNGRAALPDHERLTDWSWHPAPLSAWDGTRHRRESCTGRLREAHNGQRAGAALVLVQRCPQAHGLLARRPVCRPEAPEGWLLRRACGPARSGWPATPARPRSARRTLYKTFMLSLPRRYDFPRAVGYTVRHGLPVRPGPTTGLAIELSRAPSPAPLTMRKGPHDIC